MKKENLLTIPNLLGFYRILMFPVILTFIITKQENLFAIFVTINLLTDILDGFIARQFNMQTEFGARLDSFADDLTYLLAFTGIIVFKRDEFMHHLVWFIVFFAFLALPILIALARYGRTPSFHLYSTKIGGYIQGAFFIALFTIGFIKPFFYFMVAWGILTAIEHIAIQLTLNKPRSNVKGLYWVLREEKKQPT
jgi:CDP-diacylglycerol--glycerol-3-phosphate 3-phosphatidyltransferase